MERIKWSKKHGHDTYFGGSDVEMAGDSDDGVNQKKRKGRSRGKEDPEQRRACIDSRMLSTTVASPCQTLRELLAGDHGILIAQCIN